MKIINKYINNYRIKKANKNLFENINFFLATTLISFITLGSIEKIFYLSSLNKKIYLIVFTSIGICTSLYIIINWVINYNGLFGFNTNQSIAQEIGNKNSKIKDKLINVIQLNKSNASLDLTKLATQNIEKKLSNEKHETNINIIEINKLYLPISTILLSFFLLIIADFKQPVNRLINYNKDYKPPTPFTLKNMTNKSSALSGDSINISIKGVGSLPDSINLYWYEQSNLYHKKLSNKNNFYSYKIDNVKSDIKYWASYQSHTFLSAWDSIGIEVQNITVKQRPSIIINKFNIEPPNYTNLNIQEYIGANQTQIDVPKGSNINFIFTADTNLKSSWMVINNERISLETNNNNIYGEFELLDSKNLQIYCLGENLTPNLNPVRFSFNAINDFDPSITINTPLKEFEIDESYVIYLNFNVIDDYGIDDLWIEYSIVSPGFGDNGINKVSLKNKLLNNSKEVNLAYEWDIDDLGVLMGDEIHFWISAKDNDPYKKTPYKTEKFIGKFPSLEDLFFEIEEKEQETYNWLDEIKESIEDISDVTDEIELELLKEDDINFQNEKKLENSFDKIEDIRNEIDKVQDNIEKILEQAEKNNLFDENLTKKFNEFQNMLEEIMTPELMESMKKLQEALKNMDPEKIAEALENFEFNVEEFENQLDRYLDMFKMAQAEQQLNELSKMIENILDNQKELIDQVNNKSNQLDMLESKANKQQQRYNNFKEQMDQTINDMQNVSEKTAQTLQNLSESSIIEETQMNLKQMQHDISNNNKEKSITSCNSAEKNLQEIEQKINDIKEKFIDQEMKEITDNFIIIINNLLTISNQQEKLISISKNIRSNNPLIVTINQGQSNINRELDQIMNRLIILSNKTFFITPEINRAFGKAKMTITKVINNFAQKKVSTAKKLQKESLNNINLATELVMNALSQIKDSNSPSGIEQFMESMQQMSQQQQGINQATLQLSQLGMMQQQNLLEGLESKQKQLQEELESLLDEFPGENNGTMEKIGKDMEEIIQDFKNKNITRETILRQERILSRMLDNQKSMTQKDFSNKRKSKSGISFDYKGAQNLPENFGDRNLLLINAMESAMDEGFSNEYNKIIRNYFLNLQKDNEK
ncbi:MAG: hypothetical protein CMG66_05145 [Candidatus Marinimicrobia bacterium]|nr:hypothetical protein [Candidatus Neomarinimicrobiota bacterium]|tara:strand:+ start:14848 stop:18165 length:3318 start_codon:yes stop_codon:yes gene_type:complete